MSEIKKKKSMEKLHDRKFIVWPYNAHLYDFDYIKKLNVEEKNYLINFFNEEYCNQREKGENSIYYDLNYFNNFKQNEKEYNKFLSKLEFYRENVAAIDEMDFFVIYNQRLAGIKFRKNQKELTVPNRPLKIESEESISVYKNQMAIDAESEENKDQMFFLQCVKEGVVYKYVIEKLKEMFDELRMNNVIADLIVLKNDFENGYKKRNQFYKDLYSIFSEYKHLTNKSDNIIISNIFTNIIYKYKK